MSLNPQSKRRVITVFQLVVGLLVSLSALGQPAFLKDGLVAYYPFTGNANDESGNGRNGQMNSVQFASDRFGIGSASAAFNANGYIALPEVSTTIGQPNSSFTVSLWVKPSAKSSNHFISATTDNSYQFCRVESLSDLRVKIYHRGSGQNNEPVGNIKLTPDRWNSVIYKTDGKSGIGTVYINGAVDSGLTFNYNPTLSYYQPNRTWAIGTTLNTTCGGCNPYYEGGIDDVRIYNRALSESEIKTLYNYEENENIEFPMPVDGIFAYYPFNKNLAGQPPSPLLKTTANYTIEQNSGGISFNGIDSYLLSTNNISPFNNSSQYTVSFFAKINTIQNYRQYIFGEGPSSEYTIIYVTPDSRLGLAQWRSDTVGNWQDFYSDKIDLSVGHFFSFVVEPKTSTESTVSFYIDNKLTKTGSILVRKSPESPNKWVFGNRASKYSPGSYSQPDGYLNGVLRSFSIYKKALNNTELKEIYDIDRKVAGLPLSPEFIQHPSSQSLTAGNDATFCVTIKDSGTYNYQWQRNEQNIAGANLNCYTINSVTAAMDGGRYRVIVSNSAGTIISDSATLTVVTPPPPTIATQPTSKTVQEGVNVSLSVVASGQGTLVYQWQFNEQNLPGATSSTLNLNAVKLDTAGRYRVLVSSQYGVTISDTVTLTVNPNPPPTIVTQPVSRTPAEGTQVSLTVTATGIGTLTYQWQVNGQNIPGATSSTLVLSAVRPSVNGAYRVIVGNPYGTTISTEATVAVVVTDTDSDGLSDYEELLVGTNPNQADTDGDGLSDFAEVRTHKSNPLTTDTDGDGYSDGIEVARDGNPNNRSVTPTGALAVFPAVDVEFYTLNGVKYQLEVSSDMATWTPQGGVVVGNGGNQNHLVRASKATQFWRLKVVQ